MQRLVLDAHYGKKVEIDACGACHLVWFDALESVRLSGPGLLDLIDAMAQAQAEPHRLLRRDASCPRCSGALKTIHNRSRWGPTLQLECLRRDGAYQTFAQFLSEKGLVRATSAADRATLLRRPGGWCCLNCGGPMSQQDSRCSRCDALPGMVDAARLAAALDPEGATESHEVHGSAPQLASLHCLACGAPLPDGMSADCSSCGATLAVGGLKQAHAAVLVLADALRAHARWPAEHVRRRRLERLEADIPRRREWVAGMELGTTDGGSKADPNDEDVDWGDWRDHPYAAAGAAIVVLFALMLWLG